MLGLRPAVTELLFENGFILFIYACALLALPEGAKDMEGAPTGASTATAHEWHEEERYFLQGVEDRNSAPSWPDWASIREDGCRGNFSGHWLKNRAPFVMLSDE